MYEIRCKSVENVLNSDLKSKCYRGNGCIIFWKIEKNILIAVNYVDRTNKYYDTDWIWFI